MGYTTDFSGQFHCYRVENPQIGMFLKAVQQGDQVAVAALADWLTDHGDPRGESIARIVKSSADLAECWKLFGLKPEHAAYLHAFSHTRRMRRNPEVVQQFPDPVRQAVGLPVGMEGGYFVAGGRGWGQDRDASVVDYNCPPLFGKGGQRIPLRLPGRRKPGHRVHDVRQGTWTRCPCRWDWGYPSKNQLRQ